MVALVRSIRSRIPLFSFTSRSLLVLVGLLGLIAVLFFVPNVAQYHASRAKEAVTSAVEEVGDFTEQGTAEIVSNRAQRQASPLDAVFDLLEQHEAARGAGVQRTSANRDDTRERAAEAIDGKVITWEVIRSEPVRDALAKAKTECNEILASLAERYTASRLALINYVAAMDQVNRGSEDNLSPAESLRYLRQLDREVTTQFVREGVPRPIYQRWVKVTLGETLRGAQASDYRESSLPRYNPHFSISWVSIHYVPPARRVKLRPFTDVSSVRIGGFLESAETQKVKVYHNGKFSQDLKLSQARTEAGGAQPRKFSVNLAPSTGIWTFVSESQTGDKFMKSYNFYPRIQSVYPAARNNLRIDLGNQGKKIEALDRAFLVRASSTGARTNGLATF